MKFQTRLMIGVAVAALGLGEITAAYAQIDEIIVTARKREESLQVVPIAVTAFSGDYIRNAGMQYMSDLSRETPNLFISQQDTYSQNTAVMNLRGQVAGGSQLSNDPAVLVIIDGFIFPHPTGLQNSFFDLERVEVLKGPQGTLFGRNTTGGVVNIISRKADYNGVHGFVGGDVGNHSKYAIRGALNIPIVADKAAVRLGFQRTKRDGYGESAITGQDLGGDQNEHFFRGSLRLDPYESLRVTVVGEWFRERENGVLNVVRAAFPNALANLDASLVPASGCAPFNAVCGLAFQNMRAAQGAADIFTNYSDVDHFDDSNGWSLAATVEIDLAENVAMKSITGYRTFDNTHLTNFSGSDFKAIVTGDPLFPERDFQSEFELFTQEINIFGTGMDGSLDWQGGAFYSTDSGSDRDYVNLAQNLLPFPAGLPYFFIYDADLTQKSWSAFGQITKHLTDSLDLTMGGRYTEETRTQVAKHRTVFLPGVPGLFWSCGASSFVGPYTDNSASCAGAPRNGPERSATFSGFSWLFSVDWQATENMLLYARHARGFRGGGFDIRSPLNAPFAPETAFDVELGMKADWFEKLLRTNVAVFTTKYSNKQETIIIPGPSTITKNAAQARLWGAEAEIFANPFEGLELGATVGWLKGKYKSFIGAPVENAAFNPIALMPGFNPATYDAAGEMFDEPRWTYSVSGRYEHEVWQGVAGLQMNWAWRDKTVQSSRSTDHQLPAALRDEFFASRGLLNARFDYDITEWDLNLALWSTNLLNKEYQYSGVTQANMLGVQTGMTAEPRMFGFTLTKRIGEE